MRRYFKIWLVFVKLGAIAESAFRANLLFRFLTDIMWYFVNYAVFHVLYLHRPVIGGYTSAEMNVFLGCLYLTDALYMTFIYENLDSLSEQVRKGQMDFILLKPIASQFMVSLQKVSAGYLLNVLVALFWLIYACLAIESFSVLKILWLIILIPCGLTTFYTFKFIFSASAVIFVTSESFKYMWYQFYKLAMRPYQLYPQWLRYIVLSIIPMGFIAGVPTEFLLRPLDITLLFWVVVVTMLQLWFSHVFWRFALKSYTSASS